MIELGSAYVSIRLGGRTLHSVIEEARWLERRYTMYGSIPDPYLSRSRGAVQEYQQPIFQIGSASRQAMGTSQQGRRSRTHRVGRHGYASNRRNSRGSRFCSGFSSSSGQSSEQSSVGSGASACPTCGRFYQGPCHLMAGDCFRCGQLGHLARACPNTGYQTQFVRGSSASVVQPMQPMQPMPPWYRTPMYAPPRQTQFVGQ